MLLLLRLGLVGLPLLLVDFVTKWVIYHHLTQPIILFKGFLGIDAALNITTNRGAAWGLFSDYQIPLLLFRIIVIAFLVFSLFKKKNRHLFYPLALIIFGAIGNVCDYFIYGFVIDFIQCTFWGYPFPLFNIADMAISLGVFWLILRTSWGKERYA